MTEEQQSDLAAAAEAVGEHWIDNQDGTGNSNERIIRFWEMVDTNPVDAVLSYYAEVDSNDDSVREFLETHGTAATHGDARAYIVASLPVAAP